jgi:CTP:molybdopterin cytidylyltransferase MocA
MSPGPESIAPLAGWTAIVLAAGRGRRMGGPKALMTVGGLPWWQTQESRLAAAGVQRLWVVSAEVERAMRSGPAVAPPLVPADPDAPMFESVRAGVSAAGAASGGAFILPVDVPAPGRSTWQLTPLTELQSRRTSGFAATRPRCQPAGAAACSIAPWRVMRCTDWTI